jgi:AraC family transcriptional regulator of adaptative response / DNA-3-methyladenine glycosylase II
VFPAPDRLVRARFKNIGLVQSRAQTLRAVASAVVSGALDFESGAEPEAICRQLTSIKGIGEWTAQYVAMRALKNPDALPAGDLGLQKALGSPGRETEKNLLRRAERWRPWRAYAALLLWQQPSASGG